MIEMNGQMIFLLFLVFVCIGFLVFFVNMVLNPQPESELWEMPDFALKQTSTTISSLQTSTLKPSTSISTTIIGVLCLFFCLTHASGITVSGVSVNTGTY